MSILLNPVTISVVVLCVLCLMRLNIILSMLIACVVGGLAGSLPLFGAENSIMALFTSGFIRNSFSTCIRTDGCFRRNAG